MIYELVTSFKAEKRKVNVGDAWFRVSPLSVCRSLSWSSVCWCHPPSFDLSAVKKIVFYIIFSLLIGSDWVFFVFYREGHGLAEKLLLIIFII